MYNFAIIALGISVVIAFYGAIIGLIVIVFHALGAPVWVGVAVAVLLLAMQDKARKRR